MQINSRSRYDGFWGGLRCLLFSRVDAQAIEGHIRLPVLVERSYPVVTAAGFEAKIDVCVELEMHKSLPEDHVAWINKDEIDAAINACARRFSSR